VSPESNSSDSSSSGSSDPDGEEQDEPPPRSGFSKQNKGKIWDSAQLKNIRKNFPAVEHLGNSVLAYLGFKDIAAMAHKKDRSNKVLYEKLRKFPVWVEAGHDQSTGLAHKARALRGYVGDSRELWLQMRQHMGMTGIDPVSNYDTVLIGLNGLVSAKVWNEVHSPSSKVLSIRLLTLHVLKSAWNTSDKHEIKALDTAIR